MNTYETTATVEDHGHVRVAGVPFAPGTEVEITNSPKTRSREESTHPDGGGARAVTGLHWEGNVLVHQGVGESASVADLRDERLNRLSEERSG